MTNNETEVTETMKDFAYEIALALSLSEITETKSTIIGGKPSFSITNVQNNPYHMEIILEAAQMLADLLMETNKEEVLQ